MSRQDSFKIVSKGHRVFEANGKEYHLFQDDKSSWSVRVCEAGHPAFAKTVPVLGKCSFFQVGFKSCRIAEICAIRCIIADGYSWVF